MACQNHVESLAPRRSQDCKLSLKAQGVTLITQDPYTNYLCHSEDGTIDHAAVARMQAAKLGPKANQGAINAGLRALDRSGKPCRKWARGGFKLKSFTGVVWEIHRWGAPPRKSGEEDNEESGAASASADNSSSKENKANGQEENSASANNSNAGGDVEMNSVPSVNASSPAPIAISAAS